MVGLVSNMDPKYSVIPDLFPFFLNLIKMDLLFELLPDPSSHTV